jgi:RND family efflux transporter MFP subunit
MADSLSAMKSFLLLISLATASLSSPSCQPGKPATQATQAPPIAVQAGPVPWVTAATPVVAPGLLARTLEADLSFKTGGVIAEIAVRAGDEVKAGQVLGSLRMEELDAALTGAESMLNKAKRDLERAASLVARNAEPLEKRQNAESGVEQAEAAVRAARFNRQTADLIAPAAGKILARHAEPGEIAAPGRMILRFASDAEGWLVRVGLAQRDVVRIRVGDPADIAFPGISGALSAKVARMAGEADPASRTTLVELRLDKEPPSELRSGMVGRALLQPQNGAPRAVLPLSALVEGDGQIAHVFQLDGPCPDGGVTLVRRIEVEIEEITTAGAVVRSGLTDRSLSIVTTGAELLTDGARVLVNPAWPLASN